MPGLPPLLAAQVAPGGPLRRAAPRRLRGPVLREELELSVTITMPGRDLPAEFLDKLAQFSETRAGVRACVIGRERGQQEQWQHLQCVFRVLGSTPAAFAGEIKRHLGWMVGRRNAAHAGAAARALACPLQLCALASALRARAPNLCLAPPAPPRVGKVSCKRLKNKGMHTFTGMCGYCTKDAGKPHYGVHIKNVSGASALAARRPPWPAARRVGRLGPPRAAPPAAHNAFQSGAALS